MSDRSYIIKTTLFMFDEHTLKGVEITFELNNIISIKINNTILPLFDRTLSQSTSSELIPAKWSSHSSLSEMSFTHLWSIISDKYLKKWNLLLKHQSDPPKKTTWCCVNKPSGFNPILSNLPPNQTHPNPVILHLNHMSQSSTNKRSNLAFKQENKFRSTTSDLFYLLQQVTISKHPVPSSSQIPIHHLIYFTPLIFLPNTSSIYLSFDVYKTYNIYTRRLLLPLILFIFNNHAIWFDPIAYWSDIHHRQVVIWIRVWSWLRTMLAIGLTHASRANNLNRVVSGERVSNTWESALFNGIA